MPKKILVAKNLIVVFSLIILISFALYNSKNNYKTVNASADGNVSGFAWSENFGWVSFNSNDTGSSYDYSVDIDADGNFSGYAWSENIGWISFQESATPPDSYAFNSNCPDTCNSANNCTACYDNTTGDVYGWAKILSLGDDGWLKMNDDSVSVWNGRGVKIDQATSAVSGWAWNGNNTDDVGLGWLSFNCSDNGSCASSDYKVIATVNTPPTVTFDTMNDPGYCDASCACATSGDKKYKLRWNFTDLEVGGQASYQIILDDRNYTVAELNALADASGTNLPLKTGQLTGTANSFIPANNIYRNVVLSDGDSYYYWVKVWDEYGLDSGWVQFDVDTDGDSKTFTTYQHEFPKVDFDYSPTKPSIDEETLFNDITTLYSGFDSRLWSVVDGSIKDGDTATSTPTITFNDSGIKQVELTVTDDDGYTCSTEKDINVNSSLPSWQEVKSSN